MKTTLLLLLTAMSCVAQTNHMGLEPRIELTYATNHLVLAEYVLGTNKYANNYEFTVTSTNTIIKCNPGLSPIISKDTNGLWMVEFRKE